MKKYFLLASLIIAALQPVRLSAQVNINVNIGAQPVWGPVGYDYAEYYYLPDIESYYYVPRRQFVYLSGNNWVFASGLPARYSNYNLYNGYKVVLNTPRPYLNFKSHKVKYAKYKGNKGQSSIRYSKDPKYNRGFSANRSGISKGQSGKVKAGTYHRPQGGGSKGNHASGGQGKGKGGKGGKH